jgi:hypothetical protein
MVIEINHKQKQTGDADDNQEPEQKQPQQTELPF